MPKEIKEKQYVIYKITNNINGKIYIGLTSDFKTRKNNHLRSAVKSNTPLYRAMRKYGVENFIFSIVELCKDYDEMNEQEAFWIKELNSTDPSVGYNLKSGGDAGNYENEHPELRRKRILNTHKRGPAKGKRFKNICNTNDSLSYFVQIFFNDKRHVINGSHRTEIEAAWTADLFIRDNFPGYDIYINFPNGKTEELIKEQLASQKLKEAVRYVFYNIREYKGRYYCKGRDIVAEKDLTVANGCYETCKAKLDKFIIDNKAIKSGRRNLGVSQRNWEEIHGSIYDLISPEELELAYKEQVGKFE